jgi:methionyl-tRNA synthetase
VVRPTELVEKFGTDGVRYYFIKYGPISRDVNLTLEKLKEVYNADLANGLGNLVARVAKLCEKANFKAKQFNNSNYFTKSAETRKYRKALEEYRFNDALAFVWKKISQADKYIDTKQPWTLKGKELEKVLKPVVKEIQEITLLIKPFLPETAEKIEKQFSGKIKSAKPLFPRL